MSKNDDFKRKTSNMNYQEKTAYQQVNKEIQQERIGWILNKNIKDYSDIPSDVDDEQYTGEITIRTKKFKIKEHFGLIKKI